MVEQPLRNEPVLRNIFTFGSTHWPSDVSVRLRLADPARQASNRRRLLDALARTGPLWDPACHPELAGEGGPLSVSPARREICISEEEATNDFAGVLACVQASITVIIQHEGRPVAVVHPAGPEQRTISECIALAKVHEDETGEAPILDQDFAVDVEIILKDREAWNPPAWE